MKRIGFIGAGNMGGALALAASKTDCQLYVTDIDADKAAALCARTGAMQTDSEEICAVCDLIYLGVKPQMLAEVAALLSPMLQSRTTPYCLVSMCAGVTLARLGELFPNAPVIRIMPNTPVAVGQGMILYCYNALTTKEQTDAFLYAMAHAGRLELLDEDLFDAGTSVSGCGPAFAYLFIEAMAAGGVEKGLSRQQSLQLAAQTVLGAAQMVLETGRDPIALKDAVCSPGGATLQGVAVLERDDLKGIVTAAIDAAYKRTLELKG